MMNISVSIIQFSLVTVGLAVGTNAAAGPAQVSDKPANPREAICRQLVDQYDVRHVVFAERAHNGRGKVSDGHWYANLGYYARDPRKKAYSSGGSLRKLDLGTGKTTVLLKDDGGTFRDPVVHYDGKTILFSYRKGGTAPFHLYEIQSDGSGLRQLTSGIYDDIEPCWLPDDSIMFVSGRARRYVNCWVTQVATLYTCDRKGRNIRQISANIEHDNTPCVLPDGRVIFQRWEYVDRSQVHYHHLWSVNPDGTGQMVYFGNLHPGGVFIDPQPIPDSDRIVFINSPSHGRAEHAGSICTLTDSNGPDDLSSVRKISGGSSFRDPWALSEKDFLAAQGKSLVHLSGSGKVTALYTHNGFELNEPRPLVPRERERIISRRIDLSRTTGTLMLTDVTIGRNMGGVKKGQIKKLLVLESLPKPINYTGSMEPTSYGGTFTLERVLGTVPVEEDGSAHFDVPANRALILIALDRDGKAVKRMQSFLSVMPGEVTSCVGCHEDRRTAPRSVNTGQLQAMKRGPSRITPVPGIPDVIDYPRDIQPILDKHCVKCHNPKKRDGGVILTGDHGPVYSHSYYTLSATYQVSDGRNLPKSNYPPYGFGDAASPLMKLLRPDHYEVNLDRQEIETVRHWIHCGAPYIGTYAALIQGMIGSTGYEASHFTAIDTRILKSEKVTRASEVIKRRCGSCHTGVRNIPKHPADWGQGTRLIQPQRAWKIKQKDNRAVWRFQQHILYNLTHPAQSVQLLAPLAKKAGGYGACRELNRAGPDAGKVSDKTAAVFESRDDPDYQALLAAIQDTKTLHDSDPRWDTPGWKAPPEYIREMKRHGILPETFDREKDALDPHETDRRYWHAVTGHHLPGKEPKLHANPNIRAMCIKGTLTPDGEEFKPDSASLTTGKPATCSTAIGAYPAHFANDGCANDPTQYWAMDVAGGAPAWWQVDLEEPTDVGRVVVIGYYGDNRYYGFTVETSLDGKKWDMVADKRDNKELSTSKGHSCTFKQRRLRYIRVTQTSNSANTGRHLVEVMAHSE
ncbi:MAG: discoidin domain-containing protein [Kiritimatiellia bacterium]|jgi:hypothetical protein|nr:discoidin domain-containing protein [Kiritimatiellia bacterium]